MCHGLSCKVCLGPEVEGVLRHFVVDLVMLWPAYSMPAGGGGWGVIWQSEDSVGSGRKQHTHFESANQRR